MILRLLARNSYEFIEKGITLRQFMLYASNFAYSSLSCILRRGLQSVDSVISCRSSLPAVVYNASMCCSNAMTLASVSASFCEQL